MAAVAEQETERIDKKLQELREESERLRKEANKKRGLKRDRRMLLEKWSIAVVMDMFNGDVNELVRAREEIDRQIHELRGQKVQPFFDRWRDRLSGVDIDDEEVLDAAQDLARAKGYSISNVHITDNPVEFKEMVVGDAESLGWRDMRSFSTIWQKSDGARNFDLNSYRRHGRIGNVAADGLAQAVREISGMRGMRGPANLGVLRHMSDFAAHDYAVEMEGLDEEEEFSKTWCAYRRLCEVGGWMVGLRGRSVYVLTTPEAVEINDEGQLHNPDGPAVVFGDGQEMFHWKGVNLPDDTLLDRDVIEPEDILALNNIEVRRAAIDIYGQDRFFDDMDAEIVDEDTDNVGNRRRLLRVDLGRGEALTRWGQRREQRMMLQKVHVVCPSTGREYYLGVPQNVETCQEAVAWTFSKRGEEYNPAVET